MQKNINQNKKSAKRAPMMLSMLATSIAFASVAYAQNVPVPSSTTKTISMAGDLEIYAPSKAALQAQAAATQAAATQIATNIKVKSAPTLMMMLDTSGSMINYGKTGGGNYACIESNNASIYNAIRYTFERVYLRDKNNNVISNFINSAGSKVDISQGVQIKKAKCHGEATRFAELKDAIINLVSGPNQLDDNVNIGLARFPSPAVLSGGSILLPAKPLTLEHRWDILKAMADLEAKGVTPAASAYAEAGAYMLGSKTASVKTSRDVLIPVGRYAASKLFNCKVFSAFYPLQATSSIVEDSFMTIDGKRYPIIKCGQGFTDLPFAGDLSQVDSTNFSKLNFGLMPEFQVARLWGPKGVFTGQRDFNDKKLTNSTMPKVSKWTLDTSHWLGGKKSVDIAYFYKLFKISEVDNPISGFGYSVSSAKTSDGSKYISPVRPNNGKDITITGQCGASVTIPAPRNGYGVYFLTDGEPNWTNNTHIASLMKTALGKNINILAGALEKGDGDTDAAYYSTFNGRKPAYISSGWDAMAAFSKSLRDNKNLVGEPIRTAALGLGSSYTSSARIIKTTKIDADGNTVNVIDCDNSFANPDARNLCKLSEKGYGFGEGGFLATNNAIDITNHIKEFAKSLDIGATTPVIENSDIESVPSGAVSVPLDPYDVAGGQLPVAYMPMLEAKIGEKALTWPGNMRKFHLHDGTPVGRNKAPLFLDSTGKVNPDVVDFWSKDPAKKVQDGSFYARLAVPKANEVSSVRTVWVEDFDSIASKKYVLKKFGVNNQGQITLNGNPYGANNKFLDSATYTDENIDNLLGFLGFYKGTGWVNAGGVVTTDYTKVRLKTPAEQLRVLGASPHSSPASIFLNASLQEDGTPSNNREDYVLFGSTDGALHLANASDLGTVKTVNADTAGIESPDGGKEVFAIIPRAMLTTTNPNGDKQASALLGPKAPESQKASEPVFGVDAPWLITTSYSYDSVKQSTVLAGAQATGGFRLGAEGLVSYNIKNINSPELAYSLNKDTQGFARLGQIWVRPTKAKIQLAKTGDATDVLIFGGGYDMCYESDEYQAQVANPNASIKNMRGEDCTTAKDAVGNAVYMINAKTGELIWSATKSTNATGKNSTSNDLKNSIVGEISVLDRNSDGLLDAIYFADLGGQVFRADFQNAGKKFNTFNALRVQMLYQDSQAGTKYARRFYEKPVVSIHRGEKDFNNSRLYALVNVVSGDRSSPLSQLRSDPASADRVVGIFDVDVGASEDRFNTMRARAVARDADLHSLDGLNGQDAKKAAIASVKKARGWYYSLTRFDGYSQVKYNKAVGRSEVISGFLYTSIYNPTMRYTEDTNQCRPEIKGGTERQLYCLPYGVCKGESSKNGTGGFIRVGKGIQELVIGPAGSTDEARRSVTTIGTTPLSKIPDVSIGFGEGPKGGSPIVKAQGGTPTITGGDGTLPPLVFDSRFAFKPVRWYDDVQFATQRRN